MKVRVDETRCQGHTLCQIAAPQVLKLRVNDGHAYVEDEAVPPALEAAVRLAAAGCPESAILFEEEPASDAGPEPPAPGGRSSR
ncbi:MAG TPA: ferredoxin [Acidimicrobiales bacterium]